VLVRGANIEGQLAEMHVHGEAVCVVGKMPRTFLYAPVFNPTAAARFHYRILEAWLPQDEAADCEGKRIIR